MFNIRSSGVVVPADHLVRRRWGAGMLVVSAVVVVLMLAVAPTGFAAHAHLGSDTFKVLTYNTRGILRDTDAPRVDPDGYRFIDVLADRIVAEKPEVVLLQEICVSQSKRLAALLVAKRYPLNLLPIAEKLEDGKTDKPHNREGRKCPGYAAPAGQRPDAAGKAILVAGRATEIPVPASFDDSINSRQGCVAWDRHGTAIKVCVVHINPKRERDGIVEDEAKVVADGFRGWNGPLIVGGDFNATPDKLGHVYDRRVGGANDGYMYEADMTYRCVPAMWTPVCRRGSATSISRFYGIPVSAKKIDYVFADTRHFTARTRGTVEDTAHRCSSKDCSDHQMLWGEFTLQR